jgi:hypothetical protein
MTKQTPHIKHVIPMGRHSHGQRRGPVRVESKKARLRIEETVGKLNRSVKGDAKTLVGRGGARSRPPRLKCGSRRHVTGFLESPPSPPKTTRRGASGTPRPAPFVQPANPNDSYGKLFSN